MERLDPLVYLRSIVHVSLPQLIMISLASFAFALITRNVVSAQSIPNSFPHAYPGIPGGAFGPNWQNCISIPFAVDCLPSEIIADYEVQDQFPNITYSLPHSFAGNIPVNRAGHPNNTLFFWAFEKTNGSLTADVNPPSDDPWIIWLQGGWVHLDITMQAS